VPLKSSARGETRFTKDTLFGGALTLLQPTRGYRMNVDAVFLAAFARQRRPAELAVDLGAGVGAVALILNHWGAIRRAALVERELLLSGLARRNLRAAGLSGAVYSTDLCDGGLPVELAGKADLVVSNPPFFEPGSARASSHYLDAAARQGTVEPFLAAAALALRGSRGRAAFVYPARALQSFLEEAANVRLFAKRLRFVHARVELPARMALVELRRTKPGGLEVEPPLIEWTGPGVRSAEVSKLLAR
jgi:tRNA1(Val) A37 N6-methylase TrmN6